MSWLITNFISAFLLPPLNLLLIAALGLWFWHKRPLFSRMLLTFSFAMLWVFSTPFVAESLLHQLEGEAYVPDTKKPMADAIVVLGAGTYFHAPEYGGDTVSKDALARLRYASKLHRETGKPILVSGGKPLGNTLSEGEQMKRVLEQDFNVPVQWVEGDSDNTLQSARLSFDQLKAAGITRIFLVTHAWHMPRSVQSFQLAGFRVTPAPTAYTTRYQNDLMAYVPSADGLKDSRIFLHELIGVFWYQLKSKL